MRATFETLKSVLTHIPVFWDMTPYTFVNTYQHLEGRHSPQFQGISRRSDYPEDWDSMLNRNADTDLHGVMPKRWTCSNSALFSTNSILIVIIHASLRENLTLWRKQFCYTIYKKIISYLIENTLRFDYKDRSTNTALWSSGCLL
jgi:hypothetical protein